MSTSNLAAVDARTGVRVPLITFTDLSGNTSVGHVMLTGSTLSPVGPSNPLTVTLATVPTGAATSANQPALDPDGGALAHVTNFPLTQQVSAAALPLPNGAATSALQPAINADGGALAHVTNFPATQVVSGTVMVNAGSGTMAVSAASLPLPNGAATSALQPGINADGGALAHVTNFPATQAVSGTVTANAGSGTMAVSAASLPLPAGAATAANQLVAGTAGTPSVQVVSIQGVSGGVAQNVAGNVGGFSGVAGGSFTRPANTAAYASGQLVANSTTAASVTPIPCVLARTNAGTGQILRVRLSKSGTSITNANFRVHLYRVSPNASNGDGAAWLTDNAANYIGSLDVSMTKAFSDGAKGIGVPNEGGQIVFQAASGSQTLYALIEARAAYTPVSGEAFTLAIEALLD